MIFDYGHDDMIGMMDWGLNGWAMVLSGFFFLLIIIVLFYFLTRSNRQETHETYLNDEYSKKLKYQGNATTLANTEMRFDEAYFCPNCGKQLDGRTTKFCPFCGSMT